MYCASANLEFCNVGNTPTFQTRTRKDVLDLTLVNGYARGRVKDWHVSNVPSFSDHMFIRFAVEGSTPKEVKMVRNIRKTCWIKYAEELNHQLNGLDCNSEITSEEKI